MDRSTQLALLVLTLFALVPLSLLPHSAKAQPEPGSVHLGVRGGLTQSTFDVDQGSANSVSGFTGGLQVEYGINEALSVQLGFLYAERGADDITVQGGANTSDAFDLESDQISATYLDFPVLFKLTAPINAVEVSVMAGPSINFVSDATLNGSSRQQALQSNAPVTNRMLLYDFAGVVGGEVAVPVPRLANVEVALDGRYSYGFKNIEQTQGFDFRNQGFNGSLIVRVEL
ncbi:porin family protein [Salinibacter ruber]|uniref:porin family protein n=1 Tax=Salinibacter ruber TaxID=146919 RepID=UPI002168CE2C|nr:porin family protein [Salinibacter ruber]MCS3784577.1 hypothetical protein [Salinibacter ruber]